MSANVIDLVKMQEDVTFIKAQMEKVLESKAELQAALQGLLRFNEELCADVGVSKHYPSAENARAALAKAEQLP